MQVSLWDLATGRRVNSARIWTACKPSPSTPAGELLFAGDRSGTLRKYRITPVSPDGRLVKLVGEMPDDAWHAHETRVWSAIAGPTPDTMITAGDDGCIRVWKSDLRQPVQRTREATGDDLVVDLAFSDCGTLLFALHETSGVEVLDAATLLPMRELQCRHRHWHSLTVVAGRDEVAAGNAHGVVAVWNWRTGQHRLLGQADQSFTVTELLHSPAAGLLAVLPYEENDVRLFDVDTGAFVASLPTANHITAAFDKGGRRLAVDSMHNVYVYNLQSRQVVDTKSGHTAGIRGLAYSPLGLLASVSGDRTIRLWQPGRPPRLITGHLACPTEVAFTPDERTLVTIDDAGG